MKIYERESVALIKLFIIFTQNVYFYARNTN